MFWRRFATLFADGLVMLVGLGMAFPFFLMMMVPFLRAF